MYTKPSDQILYEYGLSEYLYGDLKACEAPTFWRTGGLTHSIPCLYKLRDRGLLFGPATGKPHSRPFQITPTGRKLLARVERGLHKPEWLSEHQVRLIEVLQTGPETQSRIQTHRIHPNTIMALAKAGYIKNKEKTFPVIWSLTDLGHEAWQEWQEWQKRTAKDDA